MEGYLVRCLEGIVGGMLAVAAAMLLAGCVGSGSDSDRQQVRDALGDAVEAFATRDVDALCGTLSRRAVVVMGRTPHTAPVGCRHDARKFLGWIEPYRNGWVPSPRRAAVAVHGDAGAVTTRLPGGDAVTIPVVREDGDWRLQGLYGATLSRIQARGTPMEDRLRPEAVVPAVGKGPRSVVVNRADGASCPAVDTARFPALAGGCAVEELRGHLRLSVRTPFGVGRFADCPVAFDLRVDGDGRAWVSDFAVSGGNPCFDAVQCWDSGHDRVPWPATIGRGPSGRLALSVSDVCLDTCVGRVEGRWSLDMTATRAGLRLRSATMVGRTGWLMRGALASRGESIAVSARPARGDQGRRSARQETAIGSTWARLPSP